ncbi:transporter substrate-binding domain-containing protein [Sphingomonadaceae bacterium LXI357]|uniref:Transporter substrate-binding domain-containing protein n=2 Tax=Stakelama marina TaxID=2826939 RepID=A0A8T4IAQ6_9SPHN|nr:transporter substrate-binding domain-containing protein [Stakelama marina]
MPASAQTVPQPAKRGEMAIATREAPPFAMKDAKGQWSGLAIDLWRDIADDAGLKYRFEQTDLDGMVQGVADGRYAASVGALTVTPAREKAVDFTHPYYTTGFGIAIGQAPPSWLILFRNFFTWGFLQAVLALAALLLVVGLLFWAVERRHNQDEFGGRPISGIGSGMWFSAVTMTTVGYGDKAPRTMAGKVIALVWMFAAILIISTFTGLIASSLTEGRLSSSIKSPSDLSSAHVGSINGSAAQGWLDERGVAFDAYPDIEAGLAAVRSGQIDAFVYDRPLLAYLIRDGGEGKGLRLVPGTFGRQDYAFALPQDSKMREPLNRALLERIESPEWAAKVKQVLGRD